MAEDLQILKSQLAALRAKPSLSVGERIAAYNLEQAIKALDVTKPITVDKLPTPISITGGLTDTELRATAVPVSATDLDIRNLVFATDKVDASGSTSVGVTSATFATSAKQDTLLTELQLKADLTETQPVKSECYISAGNSSTTNLAAGNSYTFTGVAELTGHPDMMLVLYTDQVTAISIKFSIDGTNYDSTITKVGAAGVNEFTTAVKGKRYVQVVVTTASLTTSYFRLQTQFGQFRQGNLSLNVPAQLDGDSTVVRPTDYGLAVQRGLFTGISFTNKFGRNADTVTGDAIMSSSVAYVEPATAELCNVKSTDNVKDIAGGTGARTISITGINELYDIVTETVNLNGTTNVSTVNKYFNIHRAYVTIAGTDGTATGTITITTTAAGTAILGNITIGFNQTQSTVYMVPRNYTAYVNLPNVTGQNVTANALCDIGMFKKEFGGVFRIQCDFYLTGGSTAYIPKVFGAPFKFEAKSTILFKCIVASGGGTWDVNVDYDIWLVSD